MKEIVFVIGPPNSGKSHFIKNNLQDFFIVDVYDFQKNNSHSILGILDSYDKCEKALRDACLKYDKVVLEHTLLKRKRRPQFINAVKETLDENQPIICFYSLPSLNIYKKYDLLDLEKFNKENNISLSPLSDKELKMNLEIFEIPNKEEGFINVIKIKT